MVIDSLIQKVLCLLMFAVGTMGLGCSPTPEPPKRPAEVKPPLAADAPRIQAGQQPSTAAERFPIHQAPSIPMLKVIGRAPLSGSSVTKPKTVEFKAKLLASSIASGGQASDWPGLEPGERFLRAEYRPKSTSKPITFRIKTKNAKVGSRLLGQVVQLKGYWVFTQKTAEEAADFLNKQAGVRLVPRRGQALYDAAQRQVDERLQAIDNRTRQRLSERKAPEDTIQQRIPLFFAESLSATRAP